MPNTPHDAERLLELADRCERAAADEQRGLLREAFDLVHPPKGDADALFLRFERFIDVEAYESAAMTLVPEGWRVQDLSEWNESWTVHLPDPSRKYAVAQSEAKTAALALCAASLRAPAMEKRP